QWFAGGVADALPGGDGVAGERLDQEGEGEAARHVRGEVRVGEADRGETASGGGLRGGHDRRRHGPDLDADAAREVEPIRLGREDQLQHILLHANDSLWRNPQQARISGLALGLHSVTSKNYK